MNGPEGSVLALDHAQRAAPSGCEAEAQAFFVGTLDLEGRAKEGDTRASGGAWFVTGSIELHVGVHEEFIPVNKAHVALRAADLAALEQLANRLKTADYPVGWDTCLPGVHRFFTTDPWETAWRSWLRGICSQFFGRVSI